MFSASPSTRRLLAFGWWLGLIAVMAVACAAACANWHEVFGDKGQVFFVDADCYARMTRVRIVCEHPGRVVAAHDFENYPFGTQPHTTAAVRLPDLGVARGARHLRERRDARPGRRVDFSRCWRWRRSRRLACGQTSPACRGACRWGSSWRPARSSRTVFFGTAGPPIARHRVHGVGARGRMGAVAQPVAGVGLGQRRGVGLWDCGRRFTNP